MIRSFFLQKPPLTGTAIAVKIISAARFFSSSRVSVPGVSEEDEVAARKWLANYNSDTIPQRMCDVSFSRSSGPGGQNVNKTNSKATLRVDAKELFTFVPRMLHEPLKASRYFSKSSHSLVIQADSSRKQSENIQECHRKLQDLIVTTGKSIVRGETSFYQVEKVKNLQKADNEARLRTKKAHSSKKSGRKSKGSSDY